MCDCDTVNISEKFNALIAMCLCALIFTLHCSAEEELVFKVQKDDKIKNIMDYSMGQIGILLYVRLDSERILALDYSSGLESDMRPEKSMLSIGFLSTIKKPVFRELYVSEMKDIYTLLAQYKISLMKNDSSNNKISIVRLNDLARLEIDKKSKLADAMEVNALSKDNIPQFLSLEYMLMLRDKLEYLKEDVPQLAEDVKVNPVEHVEK